MHKSSSIVRITHVMTMTLVIAAVGSFAAGQQARSITTPEQIAPLLPQEPMGLGRPANDRAVWKALAETDGYRHAVENAAKLVGAPIPEQSDDLFLDFSRTGNRSRWQTVAARRRRRISVLTIGECIENKFGEE